MTSSADGREDCAFCAIARGEDRSVETVCEGENWVAFFPRDPATPGHTLIIPRTHVSDLWAASPALASELMTAVVRVGCAIDSAVKPEGMNLITSAGKAAEQTVFHLHLHVVPRWTRDGFGPIWPIEGGTYEDAELADISDRIRAECGADASTFDNDRATIRASRLPRDEPGPRGRF
jgi:histidine triad (HIT) family protein